MVTVVMGVSGCGKTTVGSMLAGYLKVSFYDADQFHPPENISRMQAGIPLDDESRRPWLETLGRNIENWNMGNGAVLACSALKESYRAILQGRQPDNVTFLFLSGTREQIAARLSGRTGHFMPASLLDSQFSTLEPPRNALIFSLDYSSHEIAEKAAEVLRKFYPKSINGKAGD